MRVASYNVLGLRGFPIEEGRREIGDPWGETAAQHFASVFAALGADVLALQEGVPHFQAQRIAALMGVNLATLPSPVDWPWGNGSSRGSRTRSPSGSSWASRRALPVSWLSATEGCSRASAGCLRACSAWRGSSA